MNKEVRGYIGSVMKDNEQFIPCRRNGDVCSGTCLSGEEEETRGTNDKGWT